MGGSVPTARETRRQDNRARLSAWEHLISLHRAIISDMAPSLYLAASGRLPAIVIGNGWTIPPVTERPAIYDNRAGGAASAIAAAADQIYVGRRYRAYTPIPNPRPRPRSMP